MKAVISNKIYLNCKSNSDLDFKLCKELSYSIDQQPISPYPKIINNATRINPNVIAIPKGRKDLIPEDYTIVDKTVDAPIDLPEPSFMPRPNQQEAIDLIEGDGLVEAKVG